MNYFSDNQAQSSQRSFPEWVSFTVALLLLTTLVSLVVYKWITKKNQPPILSVETFQVRQSEGQFYVPFTVSNTGGEAVESVEVKAQLNSGEAVEEIGSQQIDFLSDGESQSGAFILQQNPQEEAMIVRVTGYKLP